ncbi:MAG: hypothetical protein COV67_12025 [Nitrospinae bacterium CG11_big_fil_rev_8_21_14_0_20_56_8]|nr:MAG: hypothetical protein COV67_12025 [Nitrospinae bacterium CG11_big_fil_rev_8_21_14_0_20_56_8]
MNTPSPDSSFARPRDVILISAVLLIYAFNLFSLITADPDLWGHVKFGETAWILGEIPQTDPFSYTAFGHRWINHEWAAEILFYLIYKFLGSTGLLVFKLALGWTVVGILIYLSTRPREVRANPWPLLLILGLSIPVLAPGFMTRPHLFTLLFLSILWAMLLRFFDGNRGALLWSPVVLCAWANFHGGVVAGLGIYGAVAAVAFLRSRFTGDPEGKLVLIPFALSCLGVLVNPYGLDLWRFFVFTLSSPRAITEWGPVPLFATAFWQYKTLAVLFLVSLIVPTRKRIWEVLVVGIAFYFGFRHQRHIVLAGIVATPYLTLQAAQVWERVRGRLPRFSVDFRWALWSCLLLFTAGQALDGIQKYVPNRFRILVEPQVYPSYAVGFLRANGIGGNIAVPFDWGEYVIWHLPHSKVSIDGRFRTVYPESVIEQNQNFVTGAGRWRDLLERYPTEIVLARKRDRVHERLLLEPGWIKIYEDPIAVIFITRSAESFTPVLESPAAGNLIQPREPPSFEFPG